MAPSLLGSRPGRFLRRAALRGALSAGAGLVVSRAARRLVGERVPVGPVAAGALVCGVAAGAALALATRWWWPVASRDAATLRPQRTSTKGKPSPDGRGLTIVANEGAGSPLGEAPADELEEALPGARVIEVPE